MSYPGGKNGAGIYQRQINLIPPHEVFISGFLGNCAVIRFKKPASISIGIDKSCKCVASMLQVMGKKFIGHTGCFLKWWDDAAGNIKFGKETFLYLDPPYINTETPQRYKHKAGIEFHVALLERIRNVSCNVMLCGYPSQMYDRILGIHYSKSGNSHKNEWHKVEYEAWTRGAKFKTECLWMNYPEPTVLHDYSYIGKDFRERERIRKKCARWEKKFRQLQELEKKAMLEVLSKAMPEA